MAIYKNNISIVSFLSKFNALQFPIKYLSLFMLWDLFMLLLNAFKEYKQEIARRQENWFIEYMNRRVAPAA